MLYQKSNSVGTSFFEYICYSDFHFEPHMHRHHELIHVQSGTLLMRLDGHEVEIPKGTYAWIPSNRVHSYETKHASVVDVCIFSEDFVPVFAKEIRAKKPETVTFTCRTSVDSFVRSELFFEKRMPDLYTLKAALYAVTGELMSQIRFVKTTVRSELLLDRIIQYVAEHYREDITLRQVADALGYEVHYLSRGFHAAIPTHFSRYVNLYRVDAAKELLQRADLSISEIASESGFQSLRTFNRVFLEVTGKTPSRYYGRS